MSRVSFLFLVCVLGKGEDFILESKIEKIDDKRSRRN